ncbi:PEP-CTERM sorting domain-containing protein [Duganella sp. CY15W]|uniref:choice-of-anchor J family PEP-CTERM protein n=1 Tax=Duganella sp. CY15W TaxID=2692172 RepID=UPI0013686635|nr:choice-of-anchor J domain-containing protein [Duganella sp. CY15W]MYM31005.1 PEP-CTERM sorting domain-containing protein [Duganella sp. CY15W]
MSVSFKSALALAVTLAFSGVASADALTENFDNGVPTGWTVNNLSQPVGVTDWFQGNPAVFSAHQGAADSYLGANFNSGSGTADISTWLILPTSTYHNGDTLSFYTRTSDFSLWPDNLEVRFSNVGGTNVGNTSSSVGTFSKLLLSVNPGQDLFGYPEEWTKYSVTLSGLSGATSGAFAFRYVVQDGGPAGDNSNFIGIDTLQITAVPEPSTYLMLGAGLGLIGLMRGRKKQAAA